MSLNTIGETEGDFHYMLIAKAPPQNYINVERNVERNVETNKERNVERKVERKPLLTRVSMWNTTQFPIRPFHIPPRYKAKKGSHSLRK